jgi:hypothetical protein
MLILHITLLYICVVLQIIDYKLATMCDKIILFDPYQDKLAKLFDRVLNNNIKYTFVKSVRFHPT